MNDIQITHEWLLGFCTLQWNKHVYHVYAGNKFARRVKAAKRLLNFIKQKTGEKNV